MIETRLFEDLRKAGVLWAINRALFHPRGFALALEYPADASQEDVIEGAVEPIGWSIVGDGTEPWRYADSIDEDDAFARFEGTLRQARMTNGDPDFGEETARIAAEYEIDQRLVHELRKLGDNFGPLGVALAASHLTSADALIDRIIHYKDPQTRKREQSEDAQPEPNE